MTLTVHYNAGIYTMSWERERVSVRIDRVRDQSGNVTGEICVRGAMAGDTELSHLHQARLNLTSTTARRTLAKHLNERLELDWNAVIEEACVGVLRTHRLGEPAVELHSVPKHEGPRYRLEPVLLWQLPNHLYGDGGVGKSYLAAFWAVLISAGYQFCGLTPMPCNVLYLDWEASGEELRQRIEMIEAGLEDPGCSRIMYRFCCQPLAADIEAIQAMVVENEIELVIVDSMGEALGGSPGDPREPVVEYFRALRSLRVCSLTVDHVTKNGRESGPYGSRYKWNLSRNVFEVRKQQEPGENQLKVGIYHRKCNAGQLMRPLGYSISFGEGGVYFSTADVRDEPDLRGGMTVKARIKAALRGGLMDADGIALETGINVSQVRPRLSELHKAGEVVNVKGMWALVAGGEE